MNDLISRWAAIDAIGKASDELYENIKKGATFPQRQWFDGMAQAQSILENLPSAQPEPQWIPVSERLPKIDESVLVTTDWDDLSIAWRIGVDEWYIHEGNTNSTTDDITAWRPLPEPYRRRKENR